MKKILIILTTLFMVSCHTSPYIFDIPKILATDGRKIPEILGTPYKETLPEHSMQDKNEAVGIYAYLKPKYTMGVYFYYNTGIIRDIQVAKIISGTDMLNIDTAKEKSELTAKLNLTSAYITNYEIGPIEILKGPNNDVLVNVNIMLKE